ncbi:uncharacterized protein LOC143192003 [Rhynchophorus ferrugineus]|uniref:Uncharacterized protein n=1 Tax=Rhynchophorus ferrugineus TaxID=354439 RepID=A0A834MAQ7_RHYFE|nr:hypothetical protein GWI33_014378 [Rhynchophorus ferrugineus]
MKYCVVPLTVGILLVIDFISCKSYNDFFSDNYCANLNCPEGTQFCQKRSQSTDGKHSNVYLLCEDGDGKVLLSKNFTEKITIPDVKPFDIRDTIRRIFFKVNDFPQYHPELPDDEEEKCENPDE